MKMEKPVILLVLSLVLVFGVAVSLDIEEEDLASEESLWDLYERWRSYHTVPRDLREKNKRFNVFKQNVRHVHEVNQMDKPYKLRLNKFADMTNYEFRRHYGGSKVKHYRMLRGERSPTGFMYENTTKLPASIDWRKKGAVTGIKDQGQCGEFNYVSQKIVASMHADMNKQQTMKFTQSLFEIDQEAAGLSQL